MSTNDEIHDDKAAEALRKAGVPVSEPMSEADARRAYGIQANAAMRKLSFENERALKGLFVDWAFTALNLNKYR